MIADKIAGPNFLDYNQVSPYHPPSLTYLLYPPTFKGFYINFLYLLHPQVVYCYQGHKLYLEQVRQEKVYPTKNMKMPWQKYRLLPQEFCQITNVRYLIGPPTLCQITLALLSHTQNSDSPSTSETKQRITFQIK